MNGIRRSGEEAPPPDPSIGEYGTEIAASFHLHDTVFAGQEQSVNELWQIAIRRDGRLPLGEVRTRLWDAGARFASALKMQQREPRYLYRMEVLEALADIVYLSIMQYSHDHLESGLHLVGTCFAEPANFRLSQAYYASLAKYRLPQGATQAEVYEVIRAALS